jgi:hypothetical protein
LSGNHTDPRIAQWSASGSLKKSTGAEAAGGSRLLSTDYDVAESREYPEVAVHAACSAAVTVALQRLLSLHGEAIAVPLLVWAGVASASVAFEINMSEFNACASA